MIRKALGLAPALALAAVALAQQQPASAPAQKSPPAQAQQPQPAPPQTHLKVGDTAPDFTLRDTEGKEVKLSDFRGKKNVVLAFYVLAFTGG
jgi:cytochrome oxidase Cu insertion factor (SCO1/SenC/PrrC family)